MDDGAIQVVSAHVQKLQLLTIAERCRHGTHESVVTDRKLKNLTQVPQFLRQWTFQVVVGDIQRLETSKVPYRNWQGASEMISIESEKLQRTGISDLARDASGQVVEGDVQEDKVLEHSNLGRDATCNTAQQYTCYISCCEQRQQGTAEGTQGTCVQN